MQPRDCIRKVGGAASIRVSLPPWSGADGGGRQIRTLGIYANKENPACIGHDEPNRTKKTFRGRPGESCFVRESREPDCKARRTAGAAAAPSSLRRYPLLPPRRSRRGAVLDRCG